MLLLASPLRVRIEYTSRGSSLAKAHDLCSGTSRIPPVNAVEGPVLTGGGEYHGAAKGRSSKGCMLNFLTALNLAFFFESLVKMDKRKITMFSYLISGRPQISKI